MDFDKAIKAHLDWKGKLSKYISNPDKSLNSDTVGKADQCELGKWIYNEGKAMWSQLPEFNNLIKIHAEFHKEAASIIIRADKREKMNDGSLFDSTSPYGKASLAVMSELTRLKTLIAHKKVS